MMIDDLRYIIMEHGVRRGETYYIGGCKLLEHIVDVGRFVSLLREFERRGVSFLEACRDPIGTILCGDVRFSVVVRGRVRIYADDGDKFTIYVDDGVDDVNYGYYVYFHWRRL